MTHNPNYHLETLAVQTGQYPFLAALEAPLATLRELRGRPYDFFLTELRSREERLFEQKETVLDPIRRFMNGPNKEIYHEARRFVQRQEPNFSVVSGDQPQQLQAILADPHCYRGNQIQQAKSLMEGLRAEIQHLVEQEQQRAIEAVEILQTRLHDLAEMIKLPEDKKARLDPPFATFKREVAQQNLVAVIRDSFNRFEQQEYNQLLTQISSWTAADQPAQPGPQVAEAPVEYVTQSRLTVPFAKPYLADEADVEAYLAALKAAMLAAIEEGKRIQI